MIATREEMLEQVPTGLLRNAELLVVVGSTAHGISVSQEGVTGDDLDVSGLHVPRKELLLGLDKADTVVWRSKPEGVKSEAGDVDLSTHPLQKFVKLVYGGNPTALAVLYSPDVVRETDIGVLLRDARSLFSSQRAGKAFQGYAESQYQRLRGIRGQMSVKRPDLIEAHGFDVKYAAHVLRLCYQGATLLREGYMPMPLEGEERETILAIRRGEVPQDDALEMIAAGRELLADAVSESSLPANPPQTVVNRLLVTLHEMAWARGLPFEAAGN